MMFWLEIEKMFEHHSYRSKSTRKLANSRQGVGRHNDTLEPAVELK